MSTQESVVSAVRGIEREILISADSHVTEPVDLWEKWLSPVFRDRALNF